MYCIVEQVHVRSSSPDNSHLSLAVTTTVTIHPLIAAHQVERAVLKRWGWFQSGTMITPQKRTPHSERDDDDDDFISFGSGSSRLSPNNHNKSSKQRESFLQTLFLFECARTVKRKEKCCWGLSSVERIPWQESWNGGKLFGKRVEIWENAATKYSQTNCLDGC